MQAMQLQQQQPDSNQERRGFLGDPGVLIVFLLTAIGIGGFLFWAATTKIAQGITTQGQLSIESQRKTVQHLEGGIIDQILIQDRQQVEAGTVLMTLTNTDATSRADQLLNIIVSRTVELQRIQSQLRGDPRFVPAQPEGLANIPESMWRQAATVQIKVFNDLQSALEGQSAVLDARIDGYQSQINGIEAQLAVLAGTIALERAEVARLTPLVEQQLHPAGELTAARRNLNNGLNQQSQFTSQINSARADILQAEEEKRQAQRQFVANIAEQISPVRDALLEASEQFNANNAILQRREIVAPISGQILNLAYTTVGGVIRPGEPILEIVPDDEKLFVEARVLPIQVDSVEPGMSVNARFTTLDPVSPPEVKAIIQTVDTDVTTNPETGEQFYIARVSLPEDSPEIINLKQSGDFFAGLPVEIFADMQKDRTPLSYIIQPLSEVLEKGLRGE